MAAVVTPFPSKFHARNTRSAPVLPARRDERYAAGKALRQRVARSSTATGPLLATAGIRWNW